ncbi:hypothetical protein ACQEXA_16860 [Streptomyces sp. CA-106110]
MAFAKGKPWAKEWTHKTDHSKLPERKGSKKKAGKTKGRKRKG